MTNGWNAFDSATTIRPNVLYSSKNGKKTFVSCLQHLSRIAAIAQRERCSLPHCPSRHLYAVPIVLGCNNGRLAIFWVPFVRYNCTPVVLKPLINTQLITARVFLLVVGQMQTIF
ncbi:hypothetical protein DPMN_185497 [Dreissena polymorpha]|uniref:Uncharacterized protein n=1 Tax=Dreissena polymorpha TaxID=45954 RepID=A0A9D4I8S1_DREPO|nr:hypothetical protein DPMN_185497 [Dreissena polymorpha]